MQLHDCRHTPRNYYLETCEVYNPKSMAIINKHLRDGEAIFTDTVCRRLPYMLLDLASATDQVWEAKAVTDTENKVTITVYSVLKSDISHKIDDVLTLISKTADPKLADTVHDTVERPVSVFRDLGRFATAAIVHSNFGKAEYRYSPMKLSNELFLVSCYPCHMSVAERWKSFRCSSRGNREAVIISSSIVTNM